jgi:hypothetical protein
MANDVLRKLLKMLRELQLRMVAKRSSGVARRTEPLDSGRPTISHRFRRLKRGEVPLAAFFDEKIDQAMIPLAALLHESDVLFIRSVVADKLETDPVLSALAARIASAASSQRTLPMTEW